MGSYSQRLLRNPDVVMLSLFCPALYDFFFPNRQYLYGALAVLILMLLDLATKIFSLERMSGGFRKALKSKAINSKSFFKGTIDKLIVFGVMLIVCGCAYKLSIVTELATWFSQVVFMLMFLRDVLSVLENLSDAGCEVGLFKKVIRKKMQEYVEDPDTSTQEQKSSDDSTPL